MPRTHLPPPPCSRLGCHCRPCLLFPRATAAGASSDHYRLSPLTPDTEIPPAATLPVGYHCRHPAHGLDAIADAPPLAVHHHRRRLLWPTAPPPATAACASSGHHCPHLVWPLPSGRCWCMALAAPGGHHPPPGVAPPSAGHHCPRLLRPLLRHPLAEFEASVLLYIISVNDFSCKRCKNTLTLFI
jgi:hypothetical protein